MAMEKANLNQDEKICTNNVQLQALKCPRCDSSNTKFCYYNNYSLTQPRHFCKACKRYWTRGGTLRNVPVGGSCRKNKRIRRPSSNSSSTSNSNPNPIPIPIPIPIPSSNPIINPTQMEQQQPPPPSSPNPFFYNLHSNTSDLVNLLYPNPTRFGTDLGLGFSPMVNVDHSILSSYNIHNRPNMFSSSTATLFDQQKPFSSSITDINGLMSVNGMNMKQDKTDQEEGQNRLEWNYQLAHNFHNQMESDSSLYNWNASSSIGGGSWLDPQNLIGSSVPSLI